MPVILRHRGDLHAPPPYDSWMAVGPSAATPVIGGLDDAARLTGVPRRLEAAFESIRDQWWDLGRALAAEPTGELSHAASCATSPSDMGSILAWAHLITELASQASTTLAVCDDPWLFRHLAIQPGVKAGKPPALWHRASRLWLRGILSRGKVALHLALSARRLATQRRHHQPGAAYLLVYGHPRSNAHGGDAYFGTLMAEIPGLGRVLHTDCAAGRALALGADGRSASLHAWGNPLFALGLVFIRWRPRNNASSFAWLVKRAAAHEGAGGSAAMTRWQMHCQRRWLAAMRPAAVAWPWENHPWERDFVHASRSAATRTVGYLHTVVGPHMYNQSPHANSDGLLSIPDVILCNGPAYRADLEEMGMPAERLKIAGALRFAPSAPLPYDPTAPVFVALSSNLFAARQMLAAVRKAAAKGWHFRVKTHPMYPFDFAETDTLRRTDKPLPEQDALSGVLYCASVVGLEAVLAGLPTIRFLTDDGIAMNVLPAGVDIPTTDTEGLEHALTILSPPSTVVWSDIFALPEMAIWREFLRPTN